MLVRLLAVACGCCDVVRVPAGVVCGAGGNAVARWLLAGLVWRRSQGAGQGAVVVSCNLGSMPVHVFGCFDLDFR